VTYLKVTVTTGCCRFIYFSNFPKYVYGDSSYYTDTVSDTSYVYAFTLSAAPSDYVIVTPVAIMSSGTLSCDVIVSPPSFRFDSSSAGYSLMASFVLSGNPGDYNLGFILSGPSSQEYASRVFNGSVFSWTNESVTILAVTTSPPAPLLKSVVFISTGSSMLAYFDSSTNKGSITEVVWTCSRIFNFTGADRTSCVWLNASTVVMTFNYKSGVSLVVPGGSVSVLNDTVQASCSSSALVCPYVPPRSTEAIPPSNPLYPSIQLSIPTTVGLCMNVSVDASSSYGSGGRDWLHVVWTVSAGNGTDVSAVQNALSLHTDISGPFVLDSSLLDFTTYTITLRLTNFLGMSSYASSDVTKVYINSTSSGTVMYQPTVSIISSMFRTTTPANSFTALASATLPKCASGESLTYSWYAYKNYTTKAQ
jgi:hypothetical protein